VIPLIERYGLEIMGGKVLNVEFGAITADNVEQVRTDVH
jgi:hypothetical protein